jgi:hypothetical protein
MCVLARAHTFAWVFVLDDSNVIYFLPFSVSYIAYLDTKERHSALYSLRRALFCSSRKAQLCSSHQL